MLNIKEIQEIIPHRFPMLLVDKIIEIEEKKRIVGIKNVTINEHFFQGHYPGEPVMPGVLIIEALAQVGAVGILSLEEFKGKTPYFGGINKAKFRRKVVPGDTLTLELEFVKLRSRAGVGYGRAFVEGEIAAEGELMFFIG